MTMPDAAVSCHAEERHSPRLLWLGLLFVLSPILAIFLGVVDLPVRDVIAAVTGSGSTEARAIVVDMRLPRVATGMLAGIHFALSGLLLQSMTRNPLADPSIMGVSQGATLAVTLFLVVTTYRHAPGSNILPELPIAWLPGVGLLGGLAAGAVIYAMALRNSLGPLRITLCGIAVGATLQALAVGLMAGWGSARIEILMEWLTGSLYARDWRHAAFLLPFTVAGLATLPLLMRPVSLLRFDEATARSFGLSHDRYFSFVLALACGLAASAVGVVGPVVFVGLIVPHLARFLLGRRADGLFLATLALGAVTVTLADLAGRLLGGADEIPLGVITALCGTPLLVVLLRRVN